MKRTGYVFSVRSGGAQIIDVPGNPALLVVKQNVKTRYGSGVCTPAPVDQSTAVYTDWYKMGVYV